MSAKVVLEVQHSLAKVKMVFDKASLVSECRALIEKKLQRIDPSVKTAVRPHAPHSEGGLCVCVWVSVCVRSRVVCAVCFGAGVCAAAAGHAHAACHVARR